MTNSNNTESKEIAKRIIEEAKDRLLAGVLHKNVLRHIISLGVPSKTANMILDLAEIRANEFSHYKIGKYSKEYNYSR